MTQQGARQTSFRAIGSSATAINGDKLAAMQVELEAAEVPVPATVNGRMIAWLQLRLSSTDSNLAGLMAEFAAAEGADKWSSVGAFGAIGE